MNQLVESTLALLIDRIEKGTGPWIKDWISGGSPVNGVTRRRYSGVNVLLLWAAKEKAAHSSQEWATYKQWQSLGLQVREGERSSIIFIAKDAVKKGGDKDNPEDRYRLLKCAFVFNACQLVTPPASPPTASENDRIERCELLVAACDPVIKADDSPAYRPSVDIVLMPGIGEFTSATAYYGTMMHELVHWTGHKTRLDRNLKGGKNSTTDEYAREELVAELGAAFLCAELGLDYLDSNASYLRSWLTRIDKAERPRALMQAASAATKAFEFIVSRETEKASEQAA
jgi:antirestriction protein ArdC